MNNLEYKGLKEGDYIEVVDLSQSQNCDGWGKDLPQNPWNDTEITETTMYGRVILKAWGCRAELQFDTSLHPTIEGWTRSLDSFHSIRKITKGEVEAGQTWEMEHKCRKTIRYELDSSGIKVPLGTGKREWMKRQS